MIKSISFWEKKWLDHVADAIVIGAGFVGLSAAIHYKTAFPKRRVLVLERGVIAYGASTRNAGFSCFGSIGELEDDRSHMDVDTILTTVKMRFQGLQKLLSMVDEGDMEYEQLGAWELFADEDSYLRAFAQKDYWNQQLLPIIGEQVFFEQQIDRPGFYEKAIYNPHEGQLNPKLAIEKLVASARDIGVEFLFGAEVQGWTSKENLITLNTKEGLNFSTKNLLLATNAFTKQLIEEIDLRPVRNQVLITEELRNLSWRGCFHMDKGYIYFRNVGNRILLGGARNISDMEGSAEYGNTREIMDYLTRFLEDRILPGQHVTIDHWWSGILAVGQEKKPIVKRHEQGVYIAVRLGGMGVAIGAKVGEELAELVSQNED